LLDAFEWLVHSLGRMEFEKTPLVLPTLEFFPVAGLKGHALAERLFERVKWHAGMNDWPCVVKAQEVSQDYPPDVYAIMTGQRPPKTPRQDESLGTFSSGAGGEIVITYHPALLDEPENLIATFAHELSHYLLWSFNSDPPARIQSDECATDVGAVFLGFGVICANEALRERRRLADGGVWTYWSGGGYIGTTGFSCALAIFGMLRGMPREAIAGHLEPNPRTDFNEAWRDLDRRWWERVKAIGTR
jgi:hypothetical protein